MSKLSEEEKRTRIAENSKKYYKKHKEVIRVRNDVRWFEKNILEFYKKEEE